MLRGERPDGLFEQDVQHHADACQRRLQFVADGSDQVRLGRVQQPEAGDIVKHHCHSEQRVLLVPHCQDARQKSAFCAVEPVREHGVKAVRRKCSPLARAFWAIACKREGNWPFVWRPAAISVAAGFINSMRPSLFSTKIGSGNEASVVSIGTMEPDQLVGGALTVFLKLSGHLVERERQLAQFVA